MFWQILPFDNFRPSGFHKNFGEWLQPCLLLYLASSSINNLVMRLANMYVHVSSKHHFVQAPSLFPVQVSELLSRRSCCTAIALRRFVGLHNTKITNNKTHYVVLNYKSINKSVDAIPAYYSTNCKSVKSIYSGGTTGTITK